MAVPDDVLERAQRGDAAACETLLVASYPCVVRMARALTGDFAAADAVIDFVLSRGAKLLLTWRRGTMPQNWFYHHTLLAARDRAAAVPPPHPLADPLVTAAGNADPGYIAFIKAIRGLPGQQGEAFILQRGEHMDSRLLGVTMDCSSGAAENHLKAAKDTLNGIAGDSLNAWQVTLSQAYRALGPPEESVALAVRQYARSYVRPLRIKRLVKRLLLLLVLIATAWAAWHWRQELSIWVARLVERLRLQGSAHG